MKIIPSVVLIAVTVLATAARAESQSDRDLLPVDLDQPATVGPGPWYWQTWAPPSTFDKASLAATEALIAVDVLMTLNFLGRPNEYPMGEVNPIARSLFGRHPTGGRVVAVGVAGALATAALWYWLPDPWRKEVTLTVGAFELYNTATMYAGGIRFSLP